VFFLIVSKKIKKDVSNIKSTYQIQDGKITYSDLNIPAKPLFSNHYKITGKPDYIIKKNNQYIPIEVKSGGHNTPQKNHVLQLAAYCQLVEETYKSFVPYGILVYDNSYQYKIPFDPGLRFELEHSIKNMKHILKTGLFSRNHNDQNKCKNCSMRIYCKMKII
jgi:CRISPR-associated exonuclease Cas4